MLKKKLVSILLATTLACTLFAGCSTPTKESGGEGTTAEKTETKENTSSGEREAATVVDADKLPVKGIGAQITSDVKAKEEYKIGYIAKNTTNPYMVAQSEGVKKAGEDMGFEAVTQAPSTADSVEEQVKIMEDMIQQDMDVIIVHCADSNGIMPGVRKAQEAGILVLTIGTPASEDTFLRTGVDYKETGYTIAKKMAEELGGKGNIIILEGPPGAANAIERLEGIKEALAEYPDIEIVASQTANFKRTEGMSVTENLLQKYTDVQGIIGCNDESALGGLQALKAAGMTDVLVAYISVAQNIFLNREYKTKLGLIDHKRMEDEAQELLKSLNCEYIDVKSYVKNLSVAEQQMVEIAKALSFKPRVMVFDEPTATLSEREVDSLFAQIHRLKSEGIGIIYVSHRMQEFPLIGDRITILRDGVKIKTVGINDCTNEELVNMMVGRDVSQVYVRTENKHDGIALRAENLCDYHGKVKNVNLTLKKGEIVGIAGLVRAGRTETAELLYGIRPIKSGKVYIKGDEVLPKSPIQATKLGIGLVSEDRKKQGLALDESIALNTVAVSLKKKLTESCLQAVCKIRLWQPMQ